MSIVSSIVDKTAKSTESSIINEEVTPPSGNWILATGFWDDVGVWDDSDVWID